MAVAPTGEAEVYVNNSKKKDKKSNDYQIARHGHTRKCAIAPGESRKAKRNSDPAGP